MKSQQTVIMHITASLSFSSFSVREGHWLVSIRMKELILVNCVSWEAGGGRKEKKLMETRPGGGHVLRAMSYRVPELPRRWERPFCLCSFFHSVGLPIV